MSRVTRSTLRPAAASGLILLALGLSACGGDNTSSASTGQTPPPAAATTSATSDAAGATSADAGAGTLSAKDAKVLKSSKTVALTDEGPAAIKKASTKTIGKSDLDAQIKAIQSALAKQQYKITTTAGTGANPTVLRTGQQMNVLVFPTEKGAAGQAAGYLAILKQSKLQAKLARYGNVLLILLAQKKGQEFSDAQLERFAATRKAISNLSDA